MQSPGRYKPLFYHLMNFDFYQQYKHYSNIDLLKIIKRPDDHQPAAVVVARQILDSRILTPEEIAFVDKYYQDIENTLENRKEKIDAYKNKVTSFFEPVINPSEKVDPGKWAKILLLIIGLQYAWSLFNTAKGLIRFLKCSYCSFDFTYLFELLTLLYVPIIFFLLYKRNRWGWILLFADNVFTLISSLAQSYIFFKYQPVHHGNTVSFLTPIVIKAAFVLFLRGDSIANHFGITQEIKKKTASITTIVTLLFILIMYLIFGV